MLAKPPKVYGWLLVTFPQQVEEGPQDPQEIWQCLPCVHIYQWMAQVGTTGGTRASQMLQWCFTDTWDWLFYELLNPETKETFSAPTSATKQNCPIEMNKEKRTSMKIHHQHMEARQKEKKKNIETHSSCLNRPLGHFGSRFLKRVWDRREIRKSLPLLLLHPTTHAAICKRWRLLLICA